MGIVRSKGAAQRAEELSGDVSSHWRQPMSICFRMKSAEEIRAELAKMSDAQLNEHGQTLRQF
jgi:hypothetical protein